MELAIALAVLIILAAGSVIGCAADDTPIPYDLTEQKDNHHD